MFPGMGGVDPKQMNALLRQMGVKTEELKVSRVVFEKSDGGKMVITQPSVTQIEMRGEKSFQVVGRVEETEGASQSDDVKIVMMQTGASVEQARSALQESHGDLAAAILKLKR